MDKIKLLSLPANIANWINSFLRQRSQFVTFGANKSTFIIINRGTVQGSGIGPTLYICMKSDLRALSVLINKLFKFADDTTLLVPQHTDVELKEEFEHILQWSAINKMVINMTKTKEIVFHQPNVRHDILPSTLEDIECVVDAKLLGVIFSSKLNFDAHITELLKVCSQRMYLLKMLSQQGLSVSKIHIICFSIIVSKLLYAVSAWGGHASSHFVNKINNLFKNSTDINI